MGKTDYAYEYIKGKIISGEYPPLSDISEDTLQKELEVSRTPVREAILRLERKISSTFILEKERLSRQLRWISLKMYTACVSLLSQRWF